MIKIKSTALNVIRVVVLLFSLGTLSSTQAAEDLSSTNAIISVVMPKLNPVLHDTWGPGCASVIFRTLALMGNAWFDAIAPYHSTAVGVFTDIPRRPDAESDDNYTRNVAVLYASYRVLNSIFPGSGATWREMLTEQGLDPNNRSSDNATPEGIGNIAGNAVVFARLHDGMNQLGDEGGCIYNCLPYANTTAYKPVNSAYEVNDPSRWQPYVKTSGNGIFTVQQFVTPQYATTQPYTYDDPNDYLVPPPGKIHYNNFASYKAQADAVLEASANLTDELKMRAELFDNKYQGYGLATSYAIFSNGLDYDQFVHYFFLANVAAFDAGIAAWNGKYRFDATRPYTAIPVIYGDDPVTAWGGVGKGTVNDIPASQWRQYLDVADHPEYPSGSATYCHAIARASELYFGDDTFDWTVTIKKGSSTIEPGITPANEISLYFPTWSDYASQCEQARVDGGVHFPTSVEVAKLMGRPIAELAYEFVMNHINGTVQ